MQTEDKTKRPTTPVGDQSVQALLDRVSRAEAQANQARMDLAVANNRLALVEKALELTTRGNAKQMEWWLERAREHLAPKPGRKS